MESIIIKAQWNIIGVKEPLSALPRKREKKKHFDQLAAHFFHPLAHPVEVVSRVYFALLIIIHQWKPADRPHAFFISLGILLCVG